MFKTAKMIIFPVLIPGQNFLFPGTGREIKKCHRKGREIWGLYSRETGIPAHPCNQQIPIIWYLGIGRIIVYYVEVEKWSTLAISSQIFIQGEWNSDWTRQELKKNKFCATIVFSGVVWTLAEILTANMNFSFTVGQLLYAFHDRCLFHVWELDTDWSRPERGLENRFHPWRGMKFSNTEVWVCLGVCVWGWNMWWIVTSFML